MNAEILSLENISHGFGSDSQAVLENLSFSVRPGEMLIVVGPSGCGKTTLLNIMAGHVEARAGRMVRRGRISTVRQRDGLFPWLTAGQNVELALERSVPPSRRAIAAGAALAQVGLTDCAHQYPHRLSLGMRQRVELARALAVTPDLLLMDEPFAALDHPTRLRLRRDLLALLRSRTMAVVMVTHDLEEAAELGDRILLLRGRPARLERAWVPSTPRDRPPGSSACADLLAELIEALSTDHQIKATEPTGVMA